MPPSGTRRTTILDRRAARRSRLHFWLRRGGGVVALGLVVVGGMTYLWHSGKWGELQAQATESFHAQAVDAGFAVRNLYVDGRVNTPRGLLRQTIGIDMNQSLFAVDLNAVHDRLGNIPWVKNAVVERHFPDTIAIRLVERAPFALWQNNNKLVVVDREGFVLTDKNLAAFRHLLLIVGDHAPQHAEDMVGLVRAEKDLAGRVMSAKWVGDRRWDIYLKNGVIVKLPEGDIGAAIRRLAKAQGDGGLMDRDIQSIDLRDPLRIVVQTKPGAVEDYQAAYKTEKNI